MSRACPSVLPCSLLPAERHALLYCTDALQQHELYEYNNVIYCIGLITFSRVRPVPVYKCVDLIFVFCIFVLPVLALLGFILNLQLQITSLYTPKSGPDPLGSHGHILAVRGHIYMAIYGPIYGHIYGHIWPYIWP